MAEQIDIDIVAHDKTSGVIQGIFQGIGQSMANFAMQIPGAIMNFGASVLAEANEAQLGLADLQQTLISTGGAAGMTEKELLALADGLSKTTRFSDDAVLAGENMLLTFTNIGKDVFPQATEALADIATKMKSDLPSAAIQLGKALNDPIAGISALTRIGVTFSDEQKNVIEALMRTGDVAGAQKVILAELNKEFGGQAAAAGDTFAGKMDILTNQFNNMKETVGTALIPILSELMDKVILPLVPYIEASAQAFADWLASIDVDRIINLVSVMWENLKPVLDWLFAWWSENGNYIIMQATILWDNLWSGSNRVWDELKTNFFQILKDIQAWWEDSTIKEKATDLWETIKTETNETGEAIMKFVNDTMPQFAAWWEENAPRIEELMQKVFGIFSDDLNTRIGITADVFNSILLPALENVVKTILDVGTIALAVSNGEWKAAWDAFLDITKQQTDLIVEVIINSLDLIARKFGTTFEDVSKTVWSNVREINNALSQVGLGSPLASAIDYLAPTPAMSGQKAKGGSVTAGGSYLVGEQGAEMFVPNTSGQIVPNGEGGTGAINITLNYSPSVSLGSKQEAENVLLPYILSGIRAAQANGFVATA